MLLWELHIGGVLPRLQCRDGSPAKVTTPPSSGMQVLAAIKVDSTAPHPVGVLRREALPGTFSNRSTQTLCDLENTKGSHRKYDTETRRWRRPCALYLAISFTPASLVICTSRGGGGTELGDCHTCRCTCSYVMLDAPWHHGSRANREKNPHICMKHYAACTGIDCLESLRNFVACNGVALSACNGVPL